MNMPTDFCENCGRSVEAGCRCWEEDQIDHRALRCVLLALIAGWLLAMLLALVLVAS